MLIHLCKYGFGFCSNGRDVIAHRISLGQRGTFIGSFQNARSAWEYGFFGPKVVRINFAKPSRIKSKSIILFSGPIFIYAFEHHATFFLFKSGNQFFYIGHFFAIYMGNDKTASYLCFLA